MNSHIYVFIMQRISVDVFVHSFVCASLSSNLEICGGICNHKHLNRPSRISAELSGLLGCHTSASYQLDNSFEQFSPRICMRSPLPENSFPSYRERRLLSIRDFPPTPTPYLSWIIFYIFFYILLLKFFFLLFFCMLSLYVLINIQFWCLLILCN